MKTSNFITYTLLIGMALTSCTARANTNNEENKQTVEKPAAEIPAVEESAAALPIITENGVEPFVLGQSVNNIQSKGTFYDNFVWTKTYNIFIGDHFMELNEKEYKDYKKDFGDDLEFLGVSSKAFVVSEKDTVLIAWCNESGIIETLEIKSPKLSLENGVHVGLSSEELFSKYHAVFLTTDGFPSGCMQAYHIPGLSKNITLKVFADESDGSNWFWSVFDDMEPDADKSTKVKEGEMGDPSIYKIPLKYVKNCVLSVIDVRKGGIELFNIEN